MKKLINQVDRVVEDMVEGFVRAYPRYVRRLDGLNVVVRSDAPVTGKVALVSGGGSGHEPSHGGFVGHGMLDAAVAGNVFTSPTPDAIHAAIRAVSGGVGVLLVVKNYTGDVMNFEIAAELAQADGIEVMSVLVNDDVAVENSTYTQGRRGIAGTVLVHKIAGAMAQSGAPLSEVHRVAEKVVRNVRSMGMALTPCTVPAAGKPTFTLGEDEMEIGMGIHGEPGTHRAPIAPASEVAAHLTGKVVEDLGLREGEEVAVLINGLGGTPLMELFIVNKTVSEWLEAKGIRVFRTIVGEFMTSLEMAGCSVTILRLDGELKELLEAPAETAAWRQGR